MLKRLKKSGDNAEGMEPSGFSDDNEEKYSSDYEVDEMADFIVHDINFNEKESPIRKRKVDLMSSRRVSRESLDHISGSADQLLKIKKAIVTSDYSWEGEVSKMEIDIPERMQMMEELVGPYSVDEMNTEEEASWIISQLATNIHPVTFKKTIMDGTEGDNCLKKVKREDVVRFLNLHHVEKYDVPFIAMYRKEQCLSLLDDTEQDEAEKQVVMRRQLLNLSGTRCFGPSKSWTESGCFFRREKVLFTCITTSIMKKSVAILLMRQYSHSRSKRLNQSLTPSRILNLKVT